MFWPPLLGLLQMRVFCSRTHDFFAGLRFKASFRWVGIVVCRVLWAQFIAPHTIRYCWRIQLLSLSQQRKRSNIFSERTHQQYQLRMSHFTANSGGSSRIYAILPLWYGKVSISPALPTELPWQIEDIIYIYY